MIRIKEESRKDKKRRRARWPRSSGRPDGAFLLCPACCCTCRKINNRKRRRVQLDCRSCGRTRIFNLASNQKGYDNSETTVGKFSARGIQIFWIYMFLWSWLTSYFLKKVKTQPQQKYTWQIWIRVVEYVLVCRGLRSFWGALDHWQIIF